MTKEKILDAAVKVFAEKGFEQSSMDDVAIKANVAKGTLYYHFSSKEEMLFGLIERGIDIFVEEVNKKIKNESDPKSKLEIILETQLNFFFKYRNFCRILISELWRFKTKWKEQIGHIQDNYFVTIQKIIEDGITSGEFNKDLNIEATSVAIFSLISFASLDWTIFHAQKSKEEMLATIKLIFFSGLLSS